MGHDCRCGRPLSHVPGQEPRSPATNNRRRSRSKAELGKEADLRSKATHSRGHRQQGQKNELRGQWVTASLLCRVIVEWLSFSQAALHRECGGRGLGVARDESWWCHSPSAEVRKRGSAEAAIALGVFLNARISGCRALSVRAASAAAAHPKIPLLHWFQACLFACLLVCLLVCFFVSLFVCLLACLFVC